MKKEHALPQTSSTPVGGYQLSVSTGKLRDLTIEALGAKGYPIRLMSSFLDVKQLNVMMPFALALLERTGLIYQMQRDTSIKRKPELDFRRAAMGYLVKEAERQVRTSN